MESKLRTSLKDDYVSYLNTLKGRNIKMYWLTGPGYSPGRFRLEELISRAEYVGYRALREFMNKPTTLYWACSAQTERNTCPLYPFTCIYKQNFSGLNFDNCEPSSF